jgi:flavodoxin
VKRRIVIMTIGIIYYSRTGNTCHAAKLLEEKLKERNIDTKLVEIEAVKKPGFFKAGYAAFRQKELPIKNTEFDLKEFDAILVGCPIWASRPAPLVKTFFNKATNGKGKKVGLFVTGGGASGSQTKAADIMRQYAQTRGFIPVETFLSLQMTPGKIKDGEQIIDQFLTSVLSK